MAGFGDSITKVSTTQLHPLGTIVVEPATQAGTRANQGEQHWVYIYNDDTVALRGADTAAGAAYDCAIIDTDYALFHAIRSSGSALVAQRVIGVSQHEIAAGSYGFVLMKGQGKVTTDGSLNAKGEIIVTKAAGRVGEMGAAEEASVFGMVLSVDGGVAGTNVDALLRCG